LANIKVDNMTAEEFLDNKYSNKNDRPPYGHVETEEFLIEFAKYHVQQALKEAAEKAKMREEYYFNDEDKVETAPFIDENSILNAYNLDNIK